MECPHCSAAQTGEIVARLEARIDHALSPVLARAGNYALVDYPSYSNVGDSAIWLGQIKYLRDRLGKLPAYTCDLATFNAEVLRNRVGEGTIFLSGGGNLGDLWPRHQVFREHILLNCPDNSVVQFPQTMYFNDQRKYRAFQRVVEKHKNLTLFFRDTHSYDLGRANLQCNVALCPDMAIALGKIERAEPKSDLYCLLRADRESAFERKDVIRRLTRDLRAGDWATDEQNGWYKAEQKMSSYLIHYPSLLKNVPQRLQLFVRNRAAMHDLSRGRAMLSTGRYVLTDRLHGHILCLLMGIPHILLDNSYGKNRGFFEQWTCGSALVRFASSLEEVPRVVQDLMKIGDGQGSVRDAAG